MGSRGPQPGAKYRESVKRGPKPGACYDRSLKVSSWREHRAADKFSDWLTAILEELERDAYPQNRLGANGRQALVTTIESVQGKTIDGGDGGALYW